LVVHFIKIVISITIFNLFKIQRITALPTSEAILEILSFTYYGSLKYAAWCIFFSILMKLNKVFDLRWGSWGLQKFKNHYTYYGKA